MAGSREHILINSTSSNSGNVKIIQRVVKTDRNGDHVLHKGRKAYLAKRPAGSTTKYVIDYWM